VNQERAGSSGTSTAGGGAGSSTPSPVERAGGFRWYTLIVALFATSLVVSNIIAVKLIAIGGVVVPAAVILFPLAYILGDVLTEVYGYDRARHAIWVGFAANLVAVAAIGIAGQLPAAAFWNAAVYEGPNEAQRAYEAILGFAPRLLVASFVAYLAGEFLNAMILARLKVATKGRRLWLRTITSTFVGQGVDSAVFITLAFAGVVPGLAGLIVTQWLVKTAYEVLATPLTYAVVGYLKASEGIDVFDTHTPLNPLHFSSSS
jgi:uncharacterized integral membrane protein (TIGR00697 family)